MTTKEPGRKCQDENAPDQPDLNPAGAGRRRLARAAGATGAVLLAGLSSTGWRSPMVRSAVLPAHANVTPVDSGPTGCSVAMAVTVGGEVCDGTMLVSLLLEAEGTTVVASSSTSGGCMTLEFSASTEMPPGSYDAAASIVIDANTEIPEATLEVTCCSATASGTFADLDSTARITVGTLEIDDGGCLIVP